MLVPNVPSYNHHANQLTGRTRFETQVLPLGSNLATDHVEPLENLVAARAAYPWARGALGQPHTRTPARGRSAAAFWRREGGRL